MNIKINQGEDGDALKLAHAKALYHADCPRAHTAWDALPERLRGIYLEAAEREIEGRAA